MNVRIPDADGTHRLGGSGDSPANPELAALAWTDEHPAAVTLPASLRPARTFTAWSDVHGHIVAIDTAGNVRRAPRGDLGVVVDGRPPSYFAPAAADPSQVRRFPHAVEVTREELGILEAGSPIRAYLNRHAAEALVEREIAEQTLENATRDLETAVERQAMIQRALDDLTTLEDDHGRLSRMIVGPVRRDRPTNSPDTQETRS